MSAHTPAPWRAWQERAPHGPWFVDLGANACGGELLIGFKPGGEPDEANARLIAAAPDMLAALKAIIEADEDSDDTAVLQIARTACARAEGRQP